MTAVALRMLALAIPSRGGRHTPATREVDPAGAASGTGAGPLEYLLAAASLVPAAFRALRPTPAWVRGPYVPDLAGHRTHDIQVARRLLAKHGRETFAGMFPEHAALLGVAVTGRASVTVTVVEVARPALPAGPGVPPVIVVAEDRALVKVTR